MDEQREQAEATVRQIGGVMDWWGTRGNRVLEDRVQRFQQLTSDLQRACSEACHDEFEALTMANECVSRSFEGLLKSATPSEIFAIESEILSGLMKATSLHMKAWSDFGQKIQGHCMDAARATTSDIGQEAREAASDVEEQVQETMRTTRQRIRRAAKEPSDESTATRSESE